MNINFLSKIRFAFLTAIILITFTGNSQAMGLEWILQDCAQQDAKIETLLEDDALNLKKTTDYLFNHKKKIIIASALLLSFANFPSTSSPYMKEKIDLLANLNELLKKEIQKILNPSYFIFDLPAPCWSFNLEHLIEDTIETIDSLDTNLPQHHLETLIETYNSALNAFSIFTEKCAPSNAWYLKNCLNLSKIHKFIIEQYNL